MNAFRSATLDMLRTPHLTDAFRSFILWFREPSGNAFLQNADALVMKTDDLCRVLDRLRATLPIDRVTRDSRASTTARLGKRLIALRDAGLELSVYVMPGPGGTQQPADCSHNGEPTGSIPKKRSGKSWGVFFRSVPAGIG